MGARKLKLLKLGVPKKTNTIIFGWTCGNDLWTLGENAPDESKRGGAKSPKVCIPEVDIDRSMEKDAWRLICNSRAST
jgi:hypothetical protein